MINTIGPNITRLREQCGLTIRDLAFKTTIAENSLSSIEHGKKGVGQKTVVKIADALNCSLDYLVGRSDEMFMLRTSCSDCRDRQNCSDSIPANDCGYPHTEERQEDIKSQFLLEMGKLFDKYMKADSSVDIHNPSELDELNECESCENCEGCENDEKDERTEALKALKTAIKAGKPWQEHLWNCIKLHQGYEFTTAGRGRMRTGAVSFTYTLIVSSRTGEETAEMVISTRKQAKTVTRSSVELAMENALEVMNECGYVKGPKKLGQVFGGSYLYAMFIRWGVIEGAPE